MDVKKLLKDAEKEPEGVVARSEDGRLFFIPNADAERMTIADSNLYRAFLAVKESKAPTHEERAFDPCEEAKTWLDSHEPNSAYWRALCLTYFEICV
jgi:hypothetical protein